MMKIILKEDLAYTWCRLNDKDSWYYKEWTEEKRKGGQAIIEGFLTQNELLKAWKKYHLKHEMMIRLQKKMLGE